MLNAPFVNVSLGGAGCDASSTYYPVAPKTDLTQGRLGVEFGATPWAPGPISPARLVAMATWGSRSPPGVDPGQPSAARIYDYLLGGQRNFAADRAAGDMMKSLAPELVDAASAYRGFHQRAAKWIAEQGIRQFIDLGSGLPTVGNTHQVVRKVRPVVALIDFREPAAALMTAVLHFVSDEDDPAGLVARYVAPLAEGSFVAVST